MLGSPPLDIVEIDTDHQLHSVLRCALRQSGAWAVNPAGDEVLWDASSFSLHHTPLYAAASAAVRTSIVRACCASVMGEALWIEKLGITFCAKMIYLAESLQERMLYGLSAADEANHLAALTHFARPGPAPHFLTILEQSVNDGSRFALQVFIQVILEGWGLEHYGQLRADCKNLRLTDVLTKIIADEGRHHQAGVVLASEHLQPSTHDIHFIEHAMAELLKSVQRGPVAVLDAVEAAHGGLTRAQKLQFMADVDGTHHVWRRLQVLEKLIQKVPTLRCILHNLQRTSLLQPCHFEECA